MNKMAISPQKKVSKLLFTFSVKNKKGEFFFEKCDIFQGNTDILENTGTCFQNMNILFKFVNIFKILGQFKIPKHFFEKLGFLSLLCECLRMVV